MTRSQAGMATARQRDPWRGPVLLSVLMHAAVVIALSLNLSWCTPEVKLPPVPAHVKAVVIDRRQPAPQLAAPEIAPEPAPPAPEQPEPVQPVFKKPEPAPKKPAPPKPEPKKVVPKPEPKKPAPKPAPEKPEPKPEPKKPEPKKPAPAPDFEALMAREDRELAGRESDRRAADQQAAQEAAARDAATARVVDDYKARILESLRQRWNRPPSARNGMSVTLQVNLIPGGEVVGTPAILKSSGDVAFDRSAQNAVMLASPLPVPADPAIFNAHFRQFRFVARPEDLKQ